MMTQYVVRKQFATTQSAAITVSVKRGTGRLQALIVSLRLKVWTVKVSTSVIFTDFFPCVNHALRINWNLFSQTLMNVWRTNPSVVLMLGALTSMVPISARVILVLCPALEKSGLMQAKVLHAEVRCDCDKQDDSFVLIISFFSLTLA